MRVFCLLFFLCFMNNHVSIAQDLNHYNVVWTSPSKNSLESMPCGGGDIGMNVWVENGDILIYFSRSGTFDEINGMPKLGRLRLKLYPNPFEKADQFRQELKLKEGYVELTAEKNGLKTVVNVWADIHHPIAYVDVVGNKPTTAVATYENWRFEPRELTRQETEVGRTYTDAPVKAIVKPDTIKYDEKGVLFYHYNSGETAFDVAIKQQQLEAVKSQMWNPIANLAFGGVLIGENMTKGDVVQSRYASTDFKGWSLKSKKATKAHHLKLVMHTAHVPDEQQWIDDLYKLVEATAKNRLEAKKKALEWWSAYWDRSYIYVNTEKPSPEDKRWQVGRNYQVFRYQLGCNAYGTYPSKFNGGLFTTDPEYVNEKFTYTPDFRRWGGGSFTAQNQRLLYWPMLASGDIDMMKPQFDFYKNLLHNVELRTKHYWGHNGASFVEQIENFGLPVGFEYSWKRPANFDPGLEYNAWVEYQWDTVFEFCMMILETNRYQGVDVRTYIPLIESCLRFYDEHYQYLSRQRTPKSLDQHGKLIFYPTTSVETYKMTTNPITTITAMKRVSEAILSLSDDLVSTETKTYVKGLLGRIPEGIYYREQNGNKTFAPAKSWERINNTEFPQLYTVFPWRVHGVGRAELDVAINTFFHGADDPRQKGVISWQQNAIFAAILGLRKEAGELTIAKMKDSGRRFPTWWGPGHDWVPDHNWGGSGMIGLQEMIMQCDGDKIYVGGGLPKDWNVKFKLHAPMHTIVEGEIIDGKVKHLNVIPKEREKDVRIMID